VAVTKTQWNKKKKKGGGVRNNEVLEQGAGFFFLVEGICVRLHRNDSPAEVRQAAAAAVDQRAAAGLHVQGLGSAVEECPGETAGRSESHNNNNNNNNNLFDCAEYCLFSCGLSQVVVKYTDTSSNR